MMYRARSICLVTAFVASPAWSQEVPTDPVSVLAQLVQVICVPMATDGQSLSVSGSAEAKVGLSKFLRGLADAGLTLAGQVDSDRYVNVLQQDLSGQLSDQRACNQKVYSDFAPQISDWMAAAQAPSAPGAGQVLTNTGTGNVNIQGNGNSVSTGN